MVEDKDIKKAIDCIKTDELSKSRMLNNIKNKYDYQTSYKNNKSMGLFMNYKKIGSAIAASLILVGGFAIYNIKDNTNNARTSPISSPPINAEYVPEVEFNNFDINNIKGYTKKIEIKNHDNNNVFISIDDSKFIDNTILLIESAIKTNITNEVYDQIAKSQSEGNSVVLSFINNNDIVSSVRVNLDLNIICINDEYYTISSNFINNINNELNSINNFNDINIPAEGK